MLYEVITQDDVREVANNFECGISLDGLPLGPAEPFDFAELLGRARGLAAAPYAPRPVAHAGLLDAIV